MITKVQLVLPAPPQSLLLHRPPTHVLPLQHGTVAEHAPLLVPWQHRPPPVARASHRRPPVQPEQAPPPVPQFVFVVPDLHMAEPELLLPQQPSQLAAAQAGVAFTHVHVTGSRSCPVPHSARHAPPHTIGCVAGHSHAQLCWLRVCPVTEQEVLGHPHVQSSRRI